jgi:uncharacterized membrane protein
MEWIGRFHPLVVHLPIGILVVVALFEWLITQPRWSSLQYSINILLALGVASAGAACLTGYLLKAPGSYGVTAEQHQWFGIALFIFGAVYLFIRWRKQLVTYHKWLGTIMLVLMTVTGHLGGTLTHGEDFLFTSSEPEQEINWNEAVYYSDIIRPILNRKCVSCHGSSKQKGELRLDTQEGIEKGGEHGHVVIKGDASGSELLQRVLLPLEDDDHMPPKEKPQLTSREIKLLEDWINKGTSFSKKLSEVSDATLFSDDMTTAAVLVPEEEVAPANSEWVQALKKLNVSITPVSQESNYLQIALTNAQLTDTLFTALEKVNRHIVWLKADVTDFTDTLMTKISKYENLTRLWLTNTSITDTGLTHLQSLKKLSYLNVTGTKITSAGIKALLEKSSIQQVFIYNTSITSEQAKELIERFPNIRIEHGGYTVPTFESDTTLVK